MPQTKSAKKALKASDRKRTVNDRWRRKVRESLIAIRKATTAGDTKKAEELFTTTQSALDRAARRRIIHPNLAARKKAQLKKAITAS